MPIPSPTPPGHRLRHLPDVHVGLRCDASPSTGVGHLARCLALADELGARAVTVTVLGRIDDVPWLDRAVADRGIDVVAPPDDPAGLVSLCRELGLDALVLDGYTLDPGSGAAAREAGLTVLALRDGPFGAAQSADVHLEQNLGATALQTLGPGEVSLAGVEFALLRDDVLRHRRDLLSPSRPNVPPKVLAFFGGTDAAGAAATVATLVLATALPLELTVVAATRQIADELDALEPQADQHLVVIDPTPEIATLAAAADLVVTASGSSVGELLAIGSPTAVLTVADNQLVGYTTLVERGVVAPLGSLADLRDDRAAAFAATTRLGELLASPQALLDLARRGRELVDGAGRERVADALLAAIEARPAP